MKIRAFILSIIALLVMLPAQASTGETSKDKEIQYLLSFIAQSECVFIRNGSEYDSKEARQHIERKYDYFKAELESAEDFIDKAASKSSFSGKHYHVNCGQDKITSQQWLLSALKAYRADH